MSEELLKPEPCPFCGSTRSVARSICDWSVHCCKCGAAGPRIKYEKLKHNDDFERHNAAVEAWNERIAEAAKAEMPEGDKE